MNRRSASRLPTVEGRRAVLEALRAGTAIVRITLQEGIDRGPQLQEITRRAQEEGIPVETIPRRELDRRSATRKHQGVVAFVRDQRYFELHDVIELAKGSHRPPLLVALDGIEDPHNLGAIARTADAAGAHGLVIPERRSVGVTAGSTRASAGALQHIPVARVVNLARAIVELKQAGFWATGLDGSGDIQHTDMDMTGATVIVVGSEGSGISRIVKEKCDFLVRLPMLGHVESLNASVAASIVLYEAVRQRQMKDTADG